MERNDLFLTRRLKGVIELSSPPKIHPFFETKDPNFKPFFLEIRGDIGKESGAFLLHGIQCKIVNEEVIPDVNIHSNNLYYNSHTPLVSPGLIYIWNNDSKYWADAVKTTKYIKKRSEDRLLWLILTKQLEKKHGFSKTESRKLFRTLKLSGVEEFIRWLNFFKENTPSTDTVEEILEIAASKEDISNIFNFQCNNLASAKEAMRHYIR